MCTVYIASSLKVFQATKMLTTVLCVEISRMVDTTYQVSLVIHLQWYIAAAAHILQLQSTVCSDEFTDVALCIVNHWMLILRVCMVCIAMSDGN